MPLYSLVAWPPAALADWLGRQQARLGLAAYGPPHLNVRTPFEWDGTEGALHAQVEASLRGLPAFEARLAGWRRFPHTIFLEVELTGGLRTAHARALDLPGAPAGPRDGEGYIPHLTLALGLLTWAEDDTWREVQRLRPPLKTWRVDELALTLERPGTLDEVRRFGLAAPVSDSAGKRRK